MTLPGHPKALITPRHDLSPDEIDALEDHIYEHNSTRTGHYDAKPLSFVAELNGKLIGAVAGHTWGGVCDLRQVWVHPDYRHRGLGAELVRKAIAEARGRRCASIFLATFDFQAPAFYERLGFEAVAKIDARVTGHAEYIMRLDLTR